MSQRDTILPVCQVVEVQAPIIDATAGIHGVSGVCQQITLRNTGVELAGISFDIPNKNNGLTPDFTGWADGVSSVTISATGRVYEDATADVHVHTNNGVDSTIGRLVVTNTGHYGGDADNFGIKNMFTKGGNHGSDSGGAPSGTVVISTNKGSASVPYISVTPVSGAGNNGFFRVLPGSGESLYINDTSGCVSSIQASGYGAVENAQVSGWPGVVAPHNGTATLTLQPSQKVSTIIIDNKIMESAVGAKTVFAINYGVIKQANTLKDQETKDVR
jgi:hypothetical protein|tara:strand:- start:641 stop:1462 length:822 start_codon:yes stop_codon:yes gene_type:complete